MATTDCFTEVVIFPFLRGTWHPFWDHCGCPSSTNLRRGIGIQWGDDSPLWQVMCAHLFIVDGGV